MSQGDRQRELLDRRRTGDGIEHSPLLWAGLTSITV
jgi:hypothetical protein